MVNDATVEEGRGSPRHALASGARLGSWVIEALEAEGGQGAVYRARHTETAALVAIKLLHPSLVLRPRMVSRFMREVGVLVRLAHPHIVAIQELGVLPDGAPYYVMEYLQGKTLRALLDERGRLGPAEALALLEPLCDALSVAHHAGIVHRDVKASNIMITGGATPTMKLLDFGIAKLMSPDLAEAGLTSAGRQLGTPSSMSPEQIRGGPVDARTDIYALGALLCSMLTGRPPFTSVMPGELLQQHLDAAPPRPSQRAPVSRWLDAVVMRCLEKRPENRYPTVAAFVEALRDAVGGGAAGVSPPETAERRAAALFVDVRLRETPPFDEEALAILGASALDRAEAQMTSGGFVIVTATSSAIFGLRLLSDDPAEALSERRAALALGQTLRAELPRGASAAVPIHVNMALHAGVVDVRLGVETPEIASGAIARVETWAPVADMDGLFATPSFLEGIEAG